MGRRRPARERAVTTDDGDHGSGDGAREGTENWVRSTRGTTADPERAAPLPTGRQNDGSDGDRRRTENELRLHGELGREEGGEEV